MWNSKAIRTRPLLFRLNLMNNCSGGILRGALWARQTDTTKNIIICDIICEDFEQSKLKVLMTIFELSQIATFIYNESWKWKNNHILQSRLILSNVYEKLL